MTRHILYTNLIALLLASTGCQVIADFKNDETYAGGTNAAGRGNKGGAMNQGGAGGVASTNGGSTNPGAGAANSSGGASNIGGGAAATNGGVTGAVGGTAATIGGAPSSGGTAGNGTVVPASGGTAGTGNVTTAVGGTAQGGNATGGALPGGATSGGNVTVGGAATGGKTGVGGVSTGGVTTTVGGASTGGVATGGVATGGVATGGIATGGAGTGGTSHKFVGGPCVVTTNFAQSKHDIYVRGDDAKIHRMEYLSSGTRSWQDVPALNGGLLAADSDLDCSQQTDTTPVQMVARGGMPLGNVLYANGSATQFSAFATLPYVGATTPHSPSVIDWNRDSADFYVFTTNPASSGTVTSFIRKYFADTATPFSPDGPTTLTTSVLSGPDASYYGDSNHEAIDIAVFADNGAGGMNLGWFNFWQAMGSSGWSSPLYFGSPSGSTFQFSPTICNRRPGGTSELHMFVTVENRLWHTSGVGGAFTQWEKVSDIAIGSAPDCAVGSNPSGSANEVSVIALTQQGTVLIVRGNTGAFSVEDLGVY